MESGNFIKIKPKTSYIILIYYGFNKIFSIAPIITYFYQVSDSFAKI